MKILHVIPSIAPVRGGPSQAIIEMVRVLENQGVEAMIATTNDNGLTLLDVPTNDWLRYQGVLVRFFPRFSPSQNSVREFAFSATFTQWLWHHVQDYDLIHVHAIFSYPSTVAMAIARLRGIPYIVRPLGQLCHWSLLQSAQKKQIYLKLIERSNLDSCQGLHLTSSQEQTEISLLKLRCPSFVIPHGLHISQPLKDASQQLRTHFQLPPDAPIVLFLSRLHPKKGLEYLIQALAKLPDQQFTFVIAGNGDKLYEEKIQRCLQEYNLRERTILTGFVEGELKQLLLQGADLFALTSHSENFGVSVLEALAAGTPVLVTQGVALSTEVEKHALGYVVPQEVNAITNALLKHFQLSEQQKLILRQKAHKFVLENYTWDKIARNLLQMYQAIVNQEPILQETVASSLLSAGSRPTSL
jgi:glycosyltransferase involved in cell wall biosynthesis